MQVYVIVCSILLCLLVAAETQCNLKEVQKIILQIRLETKKKTAKCPCNETSVASHNHYNQSTCSCFQIPQENNCNLTCFQDGIDKYKGIITVGHPGNFINSTFSKRAKKCVFPSCAGECRNMTAVNATIFWNEVENVFRQINTMKRS